MLQRMLVGAALVFISLTVRAGFEEDYELKNWREIEVQLPAAPLAENLVPFYVSAGTDHKFYIDVASLSVGSDGVVRYTLVIVTSGGAKNISFEGMRCRTRERRVYAFGRSDGTWSKSRSNQWDMVRQMDVNRHHAALFLDHFCPGGVIVGRVEEAQRSLRQAAGM
ncbi:MAG TPA: CNP1-like family protein [Rhodocyclaceae bacterium]|nr:CNP1-like family protein [Rhodocyclaceae bacterium]